MDKKLWRNVTNVHIKCTNTKSNKKCNKKLHNICITLFRKRFVFNE